GNLVRNTTNHSGVNFNGFTTNNSSNGNSTTGGQGLTTNGNIILNQINGVAFTSANLVNNLIGGWAVADGSTFATYVNGFGVSVLGQTTAGIVAPAFTGTDVSLALVATGNYSDAGTTRSLAAGAVVANSLRFVPTAAQTITLPTTTTVTLGVGIIQNAGFSTTIAATDATNTISGPAGGDLYVYANQSAGTIAIQPAIIGSAALVLNGPQTVSLRPTFASNTYSGGTFVQAGTLNLSAGGAFIAVPGDLTITNGAVTMSTQVNQIATTSNVTINAGGSLTLPNYTTGPTQTLNSLVFTNEGGNANPTLSLGTPTVATSTLVLSSATPITASNNSLATTPTISTGAATLTALQFSNANPVITVNSGLALTGLTISAPITQNASMTSLTKSGTGALALSGASTFTSPLNLNQGSLILGANSTPTTGTVTSGPLGVGALVISNLGTSTTLLSDGTIRTVANATTLGGDFTFGGVVSGNGLILSGQMTLGAVGRTITVSSPAVTSTISGSLISTNATGASLTKAGPGSLVLGAANTAVNFGTGNMVVSGGFLKNGIDNAIPNATPLIVNAGSGYDLNAFNQALITLSGTGFVTNSGAAKTLSIGTSVTDTTSTGNNTFSGAFVSATTGSLTVAKAGIGTLTLDGGITAYGGLTAVTGANVLVVAGTVLGGADNSFPLGTLTVANATTGTANLVATLDTGAFNQTIGGLTLSPNTTGSSATVNIATGKTLTVNGSVTIGSNTSTTDVTKANFTGGGNLVVNSSGGTFQVGGATGAANFDTTTADLSGLASINVNLGTTGTFRVGSNSGNGGSTTVGQTTLTLSPNNTITAGTLSIGESASEQVAQTLRLGSGSNVFNVNTLNASTNTGRGQGVLNFAAGTGTLTVRAADGTSRAAFNIINGAAGTGVALVGTVDLTGHSADLLLSTLTTSARSAQNGGGDATATFSFDTGNLDVLTVNASSRSGTNTLGQMTSTFNFGGGTVTIGALNLGINSSAAGTATGGSTAIVNVTGGTVNIGAISMANVSGATLNKAAGTLNFTGGSVTVNGDISRTATAPGTLANETTTLTLNGSTLDLTGHNIGVATNTVQTLNFQSGTLKNVAEINGGGAFNKTTAGTLILEGTNSYSGTTTITAGTLQVGTGGTTGTLGTNTGTITDNGTLSINRSNGVALANVISGTGAFMQMGTGTTTFSGTTANTYSGLTTVSAGVLELNKTAGINAIVGDGTSSKVTPDVLINGGTLKLLANNQLDNSVYINMTSGVFNVNGKTDTIYWLSNSGGTFSVGRGGSLTVTDPDWSGGTNDIDAGGTSTFGVLNISGGTNTVHGNEQYTGPGEGGAVLNIGAGGLNFTGANNPNLTINSDDATAGHEGQVFLSGNVTYTNAGAASTATISNGQARAIDGTTQIGFGARPGTLDLSNAIRTFTVNNGAGQNVLNVSAKVIGGSGSGLTKSGAGKLVLSAVGGNSFTGNTTINAGVLSVSLESHLGSGLVNLSGGTLEANGSFSISSPRSVTVGSSTGGIAVTSGNTLTLTTPVTGSGILTKSDTGTLVINTSTAAGIEVHVDSGTLAGTGVINGATTVSGTGQLNPGTAGTAGTLTFGGALGLNTSGTAITFDISGRTSFSSDFTNEPETNYSTGLNGANNDFILLTGATAPTFAADSVIKINVFGGYNAQLGDVINLFDWSALAGPITGFTPSAANFDLGSLGSTYTIDFSHFNTTGAIALAPEPSRMLLLLVGLLGLGLRRRRKGSL
ncbi:MAG: outer rane autotransporter barrel domain protein, partial [Verrucomicrobiaceae bacterium]|nr:outer rane autotransporter barrel domain protein [Verrucomicrobiaceae bacterium]